VESTLAESLAVRPVPTVALRLVEVFCPVLEPVLELTLLLELVPSLVDVPDDSLVFDEVVSFVLAPVLDELEVPLLVELDRLSEVLTERLVLVPELVDVPDEALVPLLVESLVLNDVPSLVFCEVLLFVPLLVPMLVDVELLVESDVLVKVYSA